MPTNEVMEIPLDKLEEHIAATDVSERNIEKQARGFIMGKEAAGKRKDVRQKLEGLVVNRIGKKGKYLVDKLFELIEGIYIVDKVATKQVGTEVRYYKTPPSLPAIIYAMDRALGKPTQKTETSEQKKGIMIVEHIIRDLTKIERKKNEQ